MIHFSVDDTIAVFKNLTVNNYQSCFSEPTLSFFKNLNLQYGLKVSMYCFYEDDSGFDLSEATRKYKEEFVKNSSWLKFGFHARNRKSDYSECSGEIFMEDVKSVYDNLKDIVSEDALTYDVRLGFGKGNEDCIKKYKKEYPAFSILYGVDDKRIVYHLSEKENTMLLKNGGYYHSDTAITVKLSERRIEKQDDIEAYLKNMQKRETNAFFTHEVHLTIESVRNDITKLCKYLKKFTF